MRVRIFVFSFLLMVSRLNFVPGVVKVFEQLSALLMIFYLLQLAHFWVFEQLIAQFWSNFIAIISDPRKKEVSRVWTYLVSDGTHMNIRIFCLRIKSSSARFWWSFQAFIRFMRSCKLHDELMEFIVEFCAEEVLKFRCMETRKKKCLNWWQKGNNFMTTVARLFRVACRRL